MCSHKLHQLDIVSREVDVALSKVSIEDLHRMQMRWSSKEKRRSVLSQLYASCAC